MIEMRGGYFERNGGLGEELALAAGWLFLAVAAATAADAAAAVWPEARTGLMEGFRIAFHRPLLVFPFVFAAAKFAASRTAGALSPASGGPAPGRSCGRHVGRRRVATRRRLVRNIDVAIRMALRSRSRLLRRRDAAATETGKAHSSVLVPAEDR